MANFPSGLEEFYRTTKNDIGAASTGSSARQGVDANPRAAVTLPPNYQRIAVTAGRCLAHLDRQCWTDLFASYDTFHEAMGLPMSWIGAKAPTAALSLSGDIARVLASLDSPDFLSCVAQADRTIRTMRVRHVNELVQSLERSERLSDIVDSTLDAAGCHDVIAAERAVLGICPFVTSQGIRYSVSLTDEETKEGVGYTKVSTPAPCPNCTEPTWSYTKTGSDSAQIACECGHHLNLEGVC